MVMVLVILFATATKLGFHQVRFLKNLTSPPPLLILPAPLTCDLALITTISDTSKNQPKRLDSDNHINLSRLVGLLALRYAI